jgi:hypothetical protein
MLCPRCAPLAVPHEISAGHEGLTFCDLAVRQSLNRSGSVVNQNIDATHRLNCTLSEVCCCAPLTKVAFKHDRIRTDIFGNLVQ